MSFQFLRGLGDDAAHSQRSPAPVLCVATSRTSGMALLKETTDDAARFRLSTRCTR